MKRLILLLIAAFCCCLAGSSFAQEDSIDYKVLEQEMDPQPLYGNITADDIRNNNILLQLEREDFTEEIRLLDWALQTRSSRLFDSLKNLGYLSIFERSEGSDRFKSIKYCLCAKHNKENFEYELKRKNGYKTFKKAYASGILTREDCGCAGLDYVPSPPRQDAAYYKKVIDAIFIKEKEELLKHRWTPATYNIWEAKQKATNEVLLAHTRKTFLQYISTNYGIKYK